MALVFANNSSLANITALPSGVSGGALNLISTQTASASASLEFSMDSTYDSYVFKFINIHPSTSGVNFQFNMSTDGGSNYNVTKTSTYFRAYHTESDSASLLGYDGDGDLAQDTNFQILTQAIGSENDECVVGTLHLYNPSSTTYVKHYITNFNRYHPSDITANEFVGGYGNTTSPVTNLKFQMSSGNIDDGIIKMYGVS